MFPRTFARPGPGWGWIYPDPRHLFLSDLDKNPGIDSSRDGGPAPSSSAFSSFFFPSFFETAWLSLTSETDLACPCRAKFARMATSFARSSYSDTRGLSRRYSAAGIPPHDGDLGRPLTAFRACFLWLSSARSVAAVEKERARAFAVLLYRPVLVRFPSFFAQHSR